MKKGLRFSLLIITAILMSGCIKFVTTVNEDGTGTWAIAFPISTEALLAYQDIDPVGSGNLVMALRGEPVTDDQTGIVYTTESRLENGLYFTYFTGQVSSSEDWAEVGNAFFHLFAGDDRDLIILTYFTPDVFANEAEGRVRVQYNPTLSEEERGELDAQLGNDVARAFQYSIEFILPGEMVEHNGTIDPLTSNPVWVLSLENLDDVQLFAESRIE